MQVMPNLCHAADRLVSIDNTHQFTADGGFATPHAGGFDAEFLAELVGDPARFIHVPDHPGPDEYHKLGPCHGVFLLAKCRAEDGNIAKHGNLGFAGDFFFLNEATQRQGFIVIHHN